MTDERPDQGGELDNAVAAFQLEGRAVRGRVLRLGETLDLILSSHDYPEPVARILGDAVMVAALVGDALKFEGRLIVQASGNGPVNFVVAEYTSGEGIRGFASMDREQVDATIAAATKHVPLIATLLGKGSFAMTIDRGPDMDQVQGIVPLEGQSLAQSAEHYFAQSEQTPTRLHLAVGEIWDEAGKKSWRGGGAMIQAFAEDQARGAVEEDWEHGLALFETIDDAELLDPDLSSATLLYRLFNEDGVRLYAPNALPRRCSCERQRLANIISSFPQDDQDHMLKNGKIVMTCEYCNRDWDFTPDEIAKSG
jgi:molecular chaperone Hsp33